MPVSTKTFLLAPVEKRFITDKLDGYEKKQDRKFGDEVKQLIISVEHLETSRMEVTGVLEFDTIQEIHHRGRILHVPQTIEVPFIADLRSSVRPYLILLHGHQEQAAEILNSILFLPHEKGVAEGSIPADEIHKFVEQNAISIKVCSWRDVNIPYLGKSTLSGPDVARAEQDFSRYNTHGKMNYVMIELSGSHWVVAISEEARAIFYTKIPEATIIKFIKEQITPLIA